MKKYLLLISILFITASVFGQSSWSTKDVTITMPAKRGFEPEIVAVDEVRYVGIEYITRTDSIILRNCGVILRKDIEYSPFFESIGIDSFFMKTMEIEEMTVLAWKWRNARYLVRLEVEFPREEIKIKYRLYSVNSNREIKSGRFNGSKNEYRYVVHDIANDIYNFLTGDPGIYRTKIVYSKKMSEAQELFMADFDGHNERQLTENGSINILPAPTPDGQYIYFTSYKDGEPKLYMLTLATGTVDLYSGHPGLNTAAKVSPDGGQVVCVLSKDGNSELYLLDRKGNITKRMTRTWQIETSPSWSPDGSRLAFTSDRTGSPQIYIMDAEGLDIQRITFQGGYNGSPCWSPKGDRIVFVTRGNGFDICSIDVNGKNFAHLARYGSNENPSFSPDGSMIVFSSERMGETNLYVMDFLGGNIQKITRGGGYSNPVWMPLPQY